MPPCTSAAGPSRAAVLSLTVLALLAAAASLQAATDPPLEQPSAAFRDPDAAIPSLWRPRVAEPLFPGPVGELGTVALPSVQSETSVAVSGLQIVCGFNDFRGSNSFSGVIYSLDGGATFNDFGQLPAPGGTTVSGDPVLAVYNPPVGDPVFYYSSIFFNPAGTQTMCVHRSTDGGQSWAGPFEVTSITVLGNAADKEWITVDPETGRLHLSWTHFAPGSSMRTTYSDDGGVTWSAAILLESTNVQGSVIAADPNGPNVYIAWRKRLTSTTSTVNFSRSTNNGGSWSAVSSIAPTFFELLPAYGFDRFSSFPSLAVNPADGGVELVYVAAATGSPAADFGDVLYRRSTNSGTTWSGPVQLNVEAGVGAGRPQIYPAVSADESGRIDVMWYDQSIGSGVSDLTDVFTSYSLDFGATWEDPVPVTPKPFHNEVGNNYSAPHQGDYIQSFSAGGTHYAAFAWMDEPSPTGSSADALVSVNPGPADVVPLRIRPGTVDILDTGCSADDFLLVAGETAELRIPLENFGASNLTGIFAVMSSLTPGVTVSPYSRSYPNLASGVSDVSTETYSITLDAAYACGQPVRLRLDIAAGAMNPTFVEFSVPTGVPISSTVLLDQTFDGVAAPALPAGWSSANDCGTCAAQNWVTTATTPSSAPNAAFVLDAAVTTFMKLEAPVVAVPATATFVDFTFDTQYDLEQSNARVAFDAGSFGYQLDGAGGTRFASSDAIEFDNRYTHYVVRSSGSSRGDRSGYSGSSGGYKTVRIRVPGLAGHTITPRWHITTDVSVGAPGWWVDNVRITAYEYACGPCTPVAVAGGGAAAFAVHGVSPNPMHGPGLLTFSLPRPAPVWAAVVAVDGRRVRTLAEDQMFAPGRNSLSWDGTDGAGRQVPAGVYWVTVRSAAGEGGARVVVLP